MMKNKKVVIIVSSVVLIAAIIGVIAFAMHSKKAEPEVDETTTVTTTASVTQEEQTTAPLSGSIVNTTESTTQSTTADDTAFIKDGVWYLADIENEECLAIAFGKDGDADVAYFNAENIEGFDAQYYKGDASYDVRTNKIIFSKLPKVTGMANLELEISGKTIKYKGKELKHFKEISLDNALKCFE